MPLKRSRQAISASAPKRTRRTYGRPDPPEEVEDGTEALTAPRTLAHSFLTLPRELRDLIYHECWSSCSAFKAALPKKGSIVRVPKQPQYLEDFYIFNVQYNSCLEPMDPPAVNSTLTFRETFATTKGKSPTLPWFLANKQVLSEALQQFNRLATWTHIILLPGDMEIIQLASWKLPVPSRRKTKYIPLLLALDNAHTIDMARSFTLYTHGEMDETEKPIHRIAFHASTTPLLKTLASSVASMPNLKHLHIRLEAHAWYGGASDLPIIVDLQPLGDLDVPNLRSLEVLVHFNNSFQDDARLMSALKIGVEKAGVEVIGANARKTWEVVACVPIKWRFEFRV